MIWDAAALMISLETVAATDANDSSIRLLLLSHSVRCTAAVPGIVIACSKKKAKFILP